MSTYHFIGIGGIGMSGLARILLSQGEKVSGSDLSVNPVMESLQKMGAHIYIGHDAKHLPAGATVIFSTDIPEHNPELLHAKAYKYACLHRSELLYKLASKRKVLAVTGTHGKTTTSALLTHVLIEQGIDPSFAVGGMIQGHNSNAHSGTGEYFSLEADESDGTFLQCDYFAAIVTNINTDHLSHYGSWDTLKAAFSKFINKSKDKKRIFYCADDKTLSEVALGGTSYGFSGKAQARISAFRQEGFQSYFTLDFEGKRYTDIQIALTGRHNVLNACAVFILCLALHVPEATIRKAFSSFQGVKRRMEKKGQASSITIYDDYAHHPTEIRASLQALRAAIHERRLVTLYQPHRYSRMQYTMHEFHAAFDAADLVIVTDLYTAGETPIAGVTTEKIIEEIKKSNKAHVVYIPRNALVDGLQAILEPHDVLITLGAGDSTKVGVELLELLQKKGIKKLKIGLFFGGMNCEHEISCISAKNFFSHLRKELYDVQGFFIGLDGRILRCTQEQKPIENHSQAVISPEVFEAISGCDVLIPVLHGPFGEDGLIQGFFETLRKPYVGCDVKSASVSMDKALSKCIALSCDIATAPFVVFDQRQWAESKESCLEEVKAKLSLPFFVKPSHLGSAVGVSKVSKIEDLEASIIRAFQYDTHVIVETGLDIREIEFAVLGNMRVRVPAPGEILSDGAFYDYDAKYSAQGFGATATANLPEDVIIEGKKLAETMYRAVGCQGLARVDFFLDKNNKYWFNEINPLPGFTPNSLYPKIWELQGSLEELMDEFIILARERFRLQERVFHFSCKNLSRT